LHNITRRNALPQDDKEQSDDTAHLSDNDALAPTTSTSTTDNNNNNNNSNNAWWEETVADILKDPESIYYENLQNFQEKGIARRNAVRDRLSCVMEDIKAKLDEITERATTVLAGQLYDKYASNIQEQERKILQLIWSNHASRVRMVEALNKANLNWESTYSDLMNRVMDASTTNESSMDDAKDDDGATDSPKVSTKTLGNMSINTPKDTKESPTLSVAAKDASTPESEDPDWNEVLRYAPHCEENIHGFLEVREKWKAVEARYVQAIESSHERIQANIERMINVVYETFQGYDERMDEQQYDIQKLMAGNQERRQKLQQALEESALQAKGLFARLMARVSTIRTGGNGKNRS
jgi:hypothetical protein